jgi:hypothetical protein
VSGLIDKGECLDQPTRDNLSDAEALEKCGEDEGVGATGYGEVDPSIGRVRHNQPRNVLSLVGNAMKDLMVCKTRETITETGGEAPIQR